MPSCAPRLMLSVVSLYGLLPVDLRSTAAVPRLNAQLLTSLGAAHPDWDLLAISPEAKPLPGVETIGVALPDRPSQAAAVRPRVGRRLSGRRAATPQSFGKSLWAEAASARLAASRPDRPSTVIICTHAEAVLAVRRAMPRSRIVHWIDTAVVWGFLLTPVWRRGCAVVPSVAVYRMTWRSLGNQYPPPMWIIPNWLDVDAFHPPRPEDRCPSRGRAVGLDQDDLVVVFIGRHWIKGAKVIEQALAALPSFGRRVVLLSAGEPRPKRRVLAHNCEVLGPWPVATRRAVQDVRGR